MAHCKYCNVQLNTSGDRCVLCGNPLEKQTDNAENYSASFPQVTVSPSAAAHLRSAWHVIIGVFICTILFDFLNEHSFWYIVASAGCVFVTLGIFSSIEAKENFGLTVLKAVMFIIIVCITLDYLLGFSKWAVTYVLPAVTMAAALLLAFMLFFRPVWFVEYFFYQLEISFLTFITILLNFMGLSTRLWPAVVSTVISLISSLILFVFFGKRSKLEIKKRLHF